MIDSSEESWVMPSAGITVNPGTYSAAQTASLLGGVGPFFTRIPVGAGYAFDNGFSPGMFIEGAPVEFRKIIPVSQYVEKEKFGIKFYNSVTGKKTWSLEPALVGVKTMHEVASGGGTQQTMGVGSAQWVLFLENWVRVDGGYSSSGQSYEIGHYQGGVRRLNATTLQTFIRQSRVDTLPAGPGMGSFNIFTGSIRVIAG